MNKKGIQSYILLLYKPKRDFYSSEKET